MKGAWWRCWWSINLLHLMDGKKTCASRSGGEMPKLMSVVISLSLRLQKEAKHGNKQFFVSLDHKIPTCFALMAKCFNLFEGKTFKISTARYSGTSNSSFDIFLPCECLVVSFRFNLWYCHRFEVKFICELITICVSGVIGDASSALFLTGLSSGLFKG